MKIDVRISLNQEPTVKVGFNNFTAIDFLGLRQN
jgi:hypothetical protein